MKHKRNRKVLPKEPSTKDEEVDPTDVEQQLKIDKLLEIIEVRKQEPRQHKMTTRANRITGSALHQLAWKDNLNKC